jgi:hypothetical protein
MMRVMSDFRRMRFGLGVTLMTDSYFAMDIGGGWYLLLLRRISALSLYTFYRLD